MSKPLDFKVPDRRRHPQAALGIMLAALILIGGVTVCRPFDAQENPDESATQVSSSSDVSLSGDVSSTERGERSSCKTSTMNQAEARTRNLERCAKALDGTVIKPGETFSFNDAVGEAGEEQGYEKATVLVDGEETEEPGGGICQVSTTLYIAAIEADLEIVERYAHTTPPDYAPIGLDAMVSFGYADLKFKNNTDDDLTIRVSAQGQTVSVVIEGLLLAEGIEIDAVSGVTKDYYEENDEGETTRHYETKSYRTVYEDGVATSTEELATDYYEILESTVLNLKEGSVSAIK